MTDRAVVNQQVQWAVETVVGTAVPADKSVRSMAVTIAPAGDRTFYRPGGHKFNALTIPNMEWAALGLSGAPTYTEIIWPLTAAMGPSVDTTVGSTGKQRVFTIDDVASITKKTLTIERGSDVRAYRVSFGLFTDLGFVFSRKNGVSVTGTGIGQAIDDGIVMTATPTDSKLIPITGRQIDFYLDVAAADLGTTKMLRAFSVEPQFGNVFGPIWPLDSALSSFADVVDLAPSSTVKISLESDATGMAYLTQMRSGDTIYARLLATGPVFETTAGTPPVPHYYSFQYDAALGIKIMSDPITDIDGVATVDIECELVNDSTLGYANQVTVINDVASV